MTIAQSYQEQDVLKKVRSLSQSIFDKTFKFKQTDKCLEQLEHYECWDSYLKLIEHCLQKYPKDRSKYLIKLLRVLVSHLNRTDEIEQTCQKIIEVSKISFDDYYKAMVTEVMIKQDTKAEILLLNSVYQHFPKVSDQIKCIERLCTLYDRSINSETQLGLMYEKLLEVDPHNLRALRYLKTIFVQTASWSDVEYVLQKMLNSKKLKPQENVRVALELASVYLYHLDQAKKALQIIDKHCKRSHLDSSAILFDAYKKLQQWGDCLKVLERCLSTVEEKQVQSALHFRIGILYKQLDKRQLSEKHFLESSRLWPSFLEPLEECLNLYIDDQNWTPAIDLLNHMAQLSQTENGKQDLLDLAVKLKSGLDRVGPG